MNGLRFFGLMFRMFVNHPTLFKNYTKFHKQKDLIKLCVITQKTGIGIKLSDFDMSPLQIFENELKNLLSEGLENDAFELEERGRRH